MIGVCPGNSSLCGSGKPSLCVERDRGFPRRARQNSPEPNGMELAGAIAFQGWPSSNRMAGLLPVGQIHAVRFAHGIADRRLSGLRPIPAAPVGDTAHVEDTGGACGFAGSAMVDRGLENIEAGTSAKRRPGRRDRKLSLLSGAASQVQKQTHTYSE